MTFSCESGQGDRPKLHAYFDLDSLLDEQIDLLVENESQLTKTVSSNEETEERISQPSREAWENEFLLLREFNLNKPHYVGSYVTKTQKNFVEYVPYDNLDFPVWKFELSYVNGQLLTIEAGLSEFKYIYSNSRSVTLLFTENQLSSFRIEGSQNMILKDEMKYVIIGKIEK